MGEGVKIGSVKTRVNKAKGSRVGWEREREREGTAGLKKREVASVDTSLSFPLAPAEQIAVNPEIKTRSPPQIIAP